MTEYQFTAICNLCPFNPDVKYRSWAELRQHMLEKHPEEAKHFPERQPKRPKLKENK
jgi:hypothetical protein